MSEKYNQGSGDGPEQASRPESADSRPVSQSRRRFTRAGLSASAIMTLASRPALATRCSVSGMNSINSSAPGVTCRGKSADYYAMNPHTWSHMIDPKTKFDHLGLAVQNGNTDFTVEDALNVGGVDLRCEATAGLINSKIFGSEQFGYNENEFRQFIYESNGINLYDHLRALNNR